MSARPELTVFAWGNSSRGDDGVGPILAERIRRLELPGVDVFEDMQLQIEHTTDMHSEVPVLFIDASVAIDSGFALQRLAPEPDHSVTTHAVSPAALLSLYSTTMRKPAPAAYQLHVAGRSFELGESPGDDCRSSIDAAWRFLQELLERPADTWADTLASASVFNGELSVA